MRKNIWVRKANIQKFEAIEDFPAWLDKKLNEESVYDAILQALPEEKTPYFDNGRLTGELDESERFKANMTPHANSGYNIALRDVRNILNEARDTR